ncbi:unnamed protein product [Adineta steineri]|uniref:Uncharacterized protein n=1 Tax=Adineta steineri TaxID=433720 RepID=A0A819AER1_9BILA|nr:unnamed protein product [Adineta steineri]
MVFIYFIILYFVSVPIIDGNHFLGGTITWRPLNITATGTPVAIVIIQTYLWAYPLVPCTQASIANNSYVHSYAGLAAEVLECIYRCGSGAIGYPNISVIPRCTDFSVAAGITIGQRLDIVYLKINDDFAAAFKDYSWRPLATDPNAGWSISTRIIVKPRSDTGLFNSAPVATVMSPINIPFNKTISITIPIGDADGDILRCRWSTKSNGINECFDVCPPNSLPPNTFIYPNCTIIIMGKNISDWYAIAVMVEDFINSSSTTPLSSTPVQFLVYVIPTSSCPTLPEIIGLPVEQSCMSLRIGQTFTSQLIARNNCGTNVTIVDISTLSFAGMIASNIIKLNSTIYYKTLSWTPTTAQLGYQVMCAMAFDSENTQSAQYCIKFYVSENELCTCPGEVYNKITSTRIHKNNSVSWILIGTLIGLILLAALVLCCCLYFHNLCLFGARGYVYKREQTIGLYHIERCIDADCHWFNGVKSSDAFSSPNTSHSDRTDLTQSTKNCINPKISSNTIVNRAFINQSMVGISISRIKLNKENSKEGNGTIKSPNRKPEIETNYVLSDQLNICRVSHMKTSKASNYEERRHTRNQNDSHTYPILSSMIKQFPMNNSHSSNKQETVYFNNFNRIKSISEARKVQKTYIQSNKISPTHHSITRRGYHSYPITEI